MRYVEELEQAAGGLERWADRRRRKYLQESAKEFSVAACADNPPRAIRALALQYETGEKSINVAGANEVVIQACRALAQGKDPASVPLVS
jgi:hypothetical protein